MVETQVAGEAALLISKAHKIHDRQERGRVDRIDDKDAADVVRLMQTTNPATVGSTFIGLMSDPIAGQASTLALTYLDELFGRQARQGVQMATRALQLAMPPSMIETLCAAYIEELCRSATRQR